MKNAKTTAKGQLKTNPPTPRENRGGARAGSGRPPIPADQRRIPRTITLTQSQWDHAATLGNGNLSAGIAAALEKDTA